MFHIVDLSRALEDGSPHYPTQAKFYRMPWTQRELGDDATSFQLLLNEHSGTHVDAPGHFVSNVPDGTWIDDIDLTRCMGTAFVIDCTAVQSSTAAPDSVLDSLPRRLQSDDIVLFNFNWEDRWTLGREGRRYMADWPFISPELAGTLALHRVRAIGVNTLSPDSQENDEAGNQIVHRTLLGAGILIFENLCRLSALPASGFQFMGLPIKVARGSGAPVRAVATWDAPS